MCEKCVYFSTIFRSPCTISFLNLQRGFTNVDLIGKPECYLLWHPLGLQAIKSGARNRCLKHIVLLDGLSIHRSALEYDVPKSTLGDRVSGKVLPGA